MERDSRYDSVYRTNFVTHNVNDTFSDKFTNYFCLSFSYHSSRTIVSSYLVIITHKPLMRYTPRYLAVRYAFLQANIKSPGVVSLYEKRGGPRVLFEQIWRSGCLTECRRPLRKTNVSFGTIH